MSKPVSLNYDEKHLLVILRTAKALIAYSPLLKSPDPDREAAINAAWQEFALAVAMAEHGKLTRERGGEGDLQDPLRCTREQTDPVVNFLSYGDLADQREAGFHEKIPVPAGLIRAAVAHIHEQQDRIAQLEQAERDLRAMIPRST